MLLICSDLLTTTESSLLLCVPSSSESGDMDGTGSSDHHPPTAPLPPALPQVQGPNEGGDLLTCGQCCQAFPLAHIMAFIQHKQGGCLSRSQAVNTSTTPPSPATRAHQQQQQQQKQPRLSNARLEPGFIELRRAATREGDGDWREESSRAGECWVEAAVKHWQVDN